MSDYRCFPQVGYLYANCFDSIRTPVVLDISSKTLKGVSRLDDKEYRILLSDRVISQFDGKTTVHITLSKEKEKGADRSKVEKIVLVKRESPERKIVLFDRAPLDY